MPQLLRLATISLLALRALATAPAPAPAPAPPTEETPNLSPPSPLSRRDEMSIGSSCAGSEGQWNCMTSSFQRCGSGLWSQVEQCALGTKCTPSGLTYEFHVDYADGYIGAAPPPSSSTSSAVPTANALGGGAEGLVDWWLLGGLAVLVVRIGRT